MHTATQTFGIPETRHAHRKRMARIYLAVISVMIVGADALLLPFVFSDSNPWEPLIGVVFGQMSSSILLIAAVYRRNAWARFVLIAVQFLAIAIFALVAVFINSRLEYQDRHQLAFIGVALGLLIGATTWLIRSKRIQHLARMGHAGGEDSSLV